MVGEILAIAGFGVTILGYLFKIQSHLDQRFDAAERHALQQDTELQLLNSKIESGLQLHDYRLRALEDAAKLGVNVRNCGSN